MHIAVKTLPLGILLDPTREFLLVHGRGLGRIFRLAVLVIPATAILLERLCSIRISTALHDPHLLDGKRVQNG